MVFSRSLWIDSVEASSHRRYCKQLCGRMEIHCWVTFACSRKATLNRLKALLKVLIYANSRHGVQMFSQISRIPDLLPKFWAKRCGLYAGVYGTELRISPEILEQWSSNLTPEMYITKETEWHLPCCCHSNTLSSSLFLCKTKYLCLQPFCVGQGVYLGTDMVPTLS